MRNDPDVRRQMFEMIEHWQQSGLSKKHTASSNPLSTIRFIIGINVTVQSMVKLIIIVEGLQN